MSKEQIIEQLLNVVIGVGREEYSSNDLYETMNTIADDLRQIEPELFEDEN